MLFWKRILLITTEQDNYIVSSSGNKTLNKNWMNPCHTNMINILKISDMFPVKFELMYIRLYWKGTENDESDREKLIDIFSKIKDKYFDQCLHFQGKIWIDEYNIFFNYSKSRLLLYTVITFKCVNLKCFFLF